MTKHLRFLFVMLLAMIWSGVMFAQKTETITIADYVPSSGSKAITAEEPLSQNGFKIYIDQNSQSTYKPGIWQNGSNLRFYKTDVLHIESTKGDINSVVFTGTVNIEGLSSPTWSDTPSASLSFTGSGTNKITVIKITYTDSSSSTKTYTKVSFDTNSGKTFTFTEGKLEGFTTPTATETTGVAGTIAYSSSNATAISVDASTGELTFLGYGEATITAKFTPEDGNTYAVSTDVYKVVNQVKKSSTVLTFSGDLKSFDKANNYAKPFETKDVPFVGSDGKTYIFNSNGGKSGSARFILPNQKNKGKLVSPEFSSYINGYNVVITYGIGSDGYPSISANGETVKGTVKGNYNNGTGATLSLDVADGSAFTVTSDNALAISKIEITPNKVDETTTITLNENSESNTIEAKTGVNVTLKRSMVANEWNTICLPFNVSKEKAQTAFGEGVKIAELNAGSTGTTLSFNSVNEISATKPYLIKPSKENTSNEYVFENVNVVADDINKKYEITEGYLAFKGIYNMMDITKDVVDNVDATYYAAFLGAGNKIYKAGTGKTKGFRAYFAIPKSASASALRVVIDGTATSIKNIDSEVVESNAPVYNLQGQRVDGNNLTPGIYVKAGKKFVVK